MEETVLCLCISNGSTQRLTSPSQVGYFPFKYAQKDCNGPRVCFPLEIRNDSQDNSGQMKQSASEILRMFMVGSRTRQGFLHSTSSP